MNYRKLGRTGLKVSALCLGTMQWGWTTDETHAVQVMDAFMEAGGNFIDTADVYSRWVEGNPGGVSEEIIGRWLAARRNRDQVVLATKVRGTMGSGPNDHGLSRKHILDAVDASLRRLQTDYIDLYQTHALDEETPIDETLRVLDDLVRAGKVRYVGASNYPAWRLMESLWSAEVKGTVRYDSLQPHYNLVHRAEFERELKGVCETFGIGVIPYSPLGGGFLTGKYTRGHIPESARADSVKHRYFNEAGWRALDALQLVAAENSVSAAAVAVAWQLAQPVITSPIIGANSVEQLRDSLAALTVILAPDQVQRLNNASAWDT
ncbi:MAG: aldo/keto reductase [Ardenticatenales bacterium]|nr:aldo/keto reductase [Ardenticatenales bacterium]